MRYDSGHNDDTTRPVSTLFGGAGETDVYASTVDALGNTYITGTSSACGLSGSLSLPGLSTCSNGSVFIAKVDASGTQLLWSVYLGEPDGTLAPWAIALDSNNNIYVAGETTSQLLPTTEGAVGPVFAGGDSDGFVMKILNDGSQIVYLTYLGGSGSDAAHALAVDKAGDAYITGDTNSTDFPTTPGALSRTFSPEPALSGGKSARSDAFLTKLDPTGTSLSYSSYFDVRDGSVTAWGLSAEPDGSTVIAGSTDSDTLPLSGVVAQKQRSGGWDTFVARMNPMGSALIFSTYLGGGQDDDAFSVATDSLGNAYVAGETFSSDYPTTLGAISTYYSGNGDMFVTKLAADGTFAYSTYIGGEEEDIAWSVTVDGSGRALVGGETGSMTFPVTVGAVQPRFAGGTNDGAVCALDSAGRSLVLGTYLGGSESDYVTGVNYDANGIAVAVGATWSTDFATAAVNSTATLAGSSYAFVTQLPINSASACSVTLTPSSASVSAMAGSAALSVMAESACGWSATVTTSWLHMSVPVGVGDVQLTYSWDANTGGPRTGSIEFGTISFTVSQAGAVSELTVGPMVPSTGTGDTATFSGQVAFSGGTVGISTVELLVSSAATATAHACHIQYEVSGGVWYLQDDGGANWLPMRAGASVENTQCRLNSAGLSVASTGATMTATVPLFFKVGYFGAQNVYLLARASNGATTGFQLAGKWFVDHPPDPPMLMNSSASAGPLSFLFHDPDSQFAGRNDIAVIEVLVGETTGPNCGIKYDLATNLLYLWNSSDWLSGVALGTGMEPITNGICTVDVAGSGVGVEYTGITPGQSRGDSSTVMILSVSFASAFAGAHNVYLRGTDVELLNSGLLNVGTWTTH